MENNSNQIVWRRGGFVVFFVFAFGITAAEEAQVPFPDGYRSWQHVKSVVVGPEHKSFASDGGKFFQFYANSQAVEGYRAGKFPNGSVIVRETLHTIAGEGESKGILTEGERSGLDVMRKDDRLYKETGGWGFETFDSKNNGRLAEKDRAQCYACHAKQTDRDLVFTSLSSVAASQGTPYPEGYRHWTFLHSSMVSPTFDSFSKKPCEKPCIAGVFHFYANDKAMDGLRTGSYPDGAILAEEMLEWLSTANGGAKEGQRRVVGVMVKDSQRYSSTAGWGYGNFDDGSRTDTLDAAKREACHKCHVFRKDQGYVFTEYRER
jgi:Cytochrome P460